jgi:DNA-directed RNA polymerase subunit M/transcription elongation factor TFIIS
MSGTYENVRRIRYGDEGATFIPICEKCGKFVKPDKTIRDNGHGPLNEPNATCKKCGRTKMLFEGYLTGIC